MDSFLAIDDQGFCLLSPDHDHTWASQNSKNMSAPLSNLAELPIEVLEQILLHLPGQDIVKMEVVRRVTAHSRRTLLTFALCGLGQPKAAKSHS